MKISTGTRRWRSLALCGVCVGTWPFHGNVPAQSPVGRETEASRQLRDGKKLLIGSEDFSYPTVDVGAIRVWDPATGALLRPAAAWLLVAHVAEVFWLVMPYASPNELTVHWMDAAALFAVLADTGFTGPIASAGLLACAACSFGLLWSGHKYQSTRLSDEGVQQATLGGLLFLYCVAAAWALCHIFSGRGAYIHFGGMLGVIMALNVYFVIIPGQRELVKAKREGRTPDPKYGAMGRQRSVHNTYFTLPVLFTMISNHYAGLYGHEWNWILLILISVAGALIRVWFVQRHKGNANPAVLAYGLIMLAVTALLSLPRAGGEASQLTSLKGSSVSEYAWSPDSKRLALVVGERDEPPKKTGDQMTRSASLKASMVRNRRASMRRPRI